MMIGMILGKKGKGQPVRQQQDRFTELEAVEEKQVL
jgi:hypothetical protein